MTFLTRRNPFSASHRLHAERLSPEENSRVFGKCNNPFGHGHDYYLEVTVAGDIDLRTGMVISPRALDAYVGRQILARLEQCNLNLDVPEFRESVPTTENLGLQIARWLREDWQHVSATSRLSRIRLEETGANTIEIQLSVD